MNNEDKTIPFVPSPAELESLRILRRKIKSLDFKADGDDEKMIEETIIWNSDSKQKGTTD
jgi:hypothetical protein